MSERTSVCVAVAAVVVSLLCSAGFRLLALGTGSEGLDTTLAAVRSYGEASSWVHPIFPHPMLGLSEEGQKEMERYNKELMWGTYRPSVYFGFKTRTAPEAVVGGIMWHSAEPGGLQQMRHDALEGQLEQFGWLQHNGKSYGVQLLKDPVNQMTLVTSMVKPGLPGIKYASRVAAQCSGSSGGVLYLYLGIDCDGAAQPKQCLRQASPGGKGLSLDAGDGKGRGKGKNGAIRVVGATSQIGPFSMEISYQTDGGKAPLEMTYMGSGPEGIMVADVESLVAEYLKGEEANDRPAVLPNAVEPDSNIIVLQVALPEGSSTLDLVICDNAESADTPCFAPEGSGSSKASMSGAITGWLESGSETFNEEFDDTFGISSTKGFDSRDTEAAQAALSNLLGGMGFWSGRNQIKDAGESFDAILFSAVPSRSFFPRGFLWDEGFHELLVSDWDELLSLDVIGHWLGVMHLPAAHVQVVEGAQQSQDSFGGWIPREQILGETSRRRVPAEFIPQDVNVANPPTLMLLVRKLLRSGSKRGGGEYSLLKAELLRNSYASIGRNSLFQSFALAPHDVNCSNRLRCVLFVVVRFAPRLDEWIKWFRPDWSAGLSPVGSFQWRGRDPGEDRLNPLTLASGLDDYPRASHPSETQEYHVDVMCWAILACQVMGELSTVVGYSPMLPYARIGQELSQELDALHWSNTWQSYLDVGLHSPLGQVMEEAVVVCAGDSGRKNVPVLLTDLRAGQFECPPLYPRQLYPLGDGKGGLLLKPRWYGSPPKQMHVPHVGYVSLFPLLLELLAPSNPHLGRIMDQMADSSLLWSPFGIRSLSKQDPFYQLGNNPGDEPYWRGHIWLNVNYLACAALHRYAGKRGPYQERAANLYRKLRLALIDTVLESYHETGFFWEQYDDTTGKGRRSHPFAGWTSLIVKIMAEDY
ncbi:unnamed protein product [Chrysoparadoxa australica]